MAVKNRNFAEGLIFHSDRGVQYARRKFAKTIESYGVIRSMSRKGNCWGNAVAESFFKSLKKELIYGNRLVTKEKMEIFEYIEIWYNKKSHHSTLNYKIIQEFNNQNKIYQNEGSNWKFCLHIKYWSQWRNVFILLNDKKKRHLS